jgi:hypothetical protein
VDGVSVFGAINDALFTLDGVAIAEDSVTDREACQVNEMGAIRGLDVVVSCFTGLSGTTVLSLSPIVAIISVGRGSFVGDWKSSLSKLTPPSKSSSSSPSESGICVNELSIEADCTTDEEI